MRRGCLLAAVLALLPAAVHSASTAYDSEDFLPGNAVAPTGFFRLGKMPSGRWTAYDPLGRMTFLRGVDHVNYRGVLCYRKAVPYSHYRDWNDAHYPSVEAWCGETLGRLRDWGFNMLGGGASPELHHRGMVYCFSLNLSHGLTVGPGKEGLWICPHEGSPCTEFPNVFHPDFAKWCDSVAAERCVPNRDDPWLFGYCIDNELAWWGRGRNPTGLYDCVAKLPVSHTARIAAEDFVRKQGLDPAGEVPAAVKNAFLGLVAEKYFSVATAAIRRHDPNHLILGVRFAGLDGADEVVWRAAGKYCDAVTFNCYPWADLDRNVVLTRRGPGAERVVEAFQRRHEQSGKPIIVTEWSFPALDSGLPCTCGGGQRFRTQRERAKASALFARTMLAMPFVVGYSYFMWVDEPPEGISGLYPEDTNYGLVNERGEPYRLLTEMFKRLHGELPKHLSSPQPRERPAGFLSADEFRVEYKIASAAGFSRTGDGWTWTNRVGMVLSGSLGKGRAVRRVTLSGAELGEFGAMGHYDDEGVPLWHEAAEVQAFDFADGRLTVSCSCNGWHGKRFSFDLRIVLDGNRPEFLVEIVRVRNVGTVPIRFNSLFLCQYSPFARERPLKRPMTNLWTGFETTAWRAKDGRVFGALSKAPGIRYFDYHADDTGVHPDAAFIPSGLPDELSPGMRFDCSGQVWMLCFGER